MCSKQMEKLHLCNEERRLGVQQFTYMKKIHLTLGCNECIIEWYTQPCRVNLEDFSL